MFPLSFFTFWKDLIPSKKKKMMKKKQQKKKHSHLPRIKLHSRRLSNSTEFYEEKVNKKKENIGH